ASKLGSAQHNYEKLQLKQVTDTTLKESSKIEIDKLAIEQARREVELLKERIEWHKKSSEATYNIISSKKARAENKLNEIKRGIEGFEAKADRDGVVVYKTKWNGEKPKVGENTWSGQPLMEIPDLNSLLAEALVAEVDVGKIKLGQRAE